VYEEELIYLMTKVYRRTMAYIWTYASLSPSYLQQQIFWCHYTVPAEVALMGEQDRSFMPSGVERIGAEWPPPGGPPRVRPSHGLTPRGIN